jgi:hypothetical protein
MMERTVSTVGVIAVIVVAAGGIGTVGFLYMDSNQRYATLQAQFDSLMEDYDNLTTQYENLLLSYNLLQGNYDDLQTSYDDLEEDFNFTVSEYDLLYTSYNDLFDDYNILNASYSTLCNYIQNQILPIQMSNWADAARRVHLQAYFDQASSNKEWNMEYEKFCRNLVLHASGQYDAFSDISNALAQALLLGSDTMTLADDAMKVMAHARDNVWDHFPYRWSWHFTGTGAEIYGIDKIVQDCIDNIEYEWDNDITYMQSSPEWDYPKHPVETAFRKMGDCEDQAMLCAAYLERDYYVDSLIDVYYETILCLIHDDDHRDYTELYHSGLLVHIDDTAAFTAAYPSCGLWNLGSNDPYYPSYTWCFIDPTWDTPFGTEPAWLDDYIDNGMTEDVITFAICELGGAVW